MLVDARPDVCTHLAHDSVGPEVCDAGSFRSGPESVEVDER